MGRPIAAPKRASLWCNATRVVEVEVDASLKDVAPIRHAFCTLVHGHLGSHLDHLGCTWVAAVEDRSGVWPWEPIRLSQIARAVAAQ